MTGLRVLALFVSFLAASARAELSAVEARIVASVKERSAAAIELLERSVHVNSGTMNHDGVREVGRLFAAELEALGFRTRWIDMPPAMQRAGHLLATREGRQGKRLLLLGHLDTVFEKQSPGQAWSRRGARVYGPGVVDMKGGNVAMVEALRALHANGRLDDTTVTVILTGDEERVGFPREVARRELVEAARRSDAALSFEGATRSREGHDLVNTARRGSGGFTLRVTAQPGHSSGIFHPRAPSLGAIYEGARILNAFREEVAEPGLSFSPGIALGGTVADYDVALSSGTAFGKTNVIARSFVVGSDLRYLDAAQLERARERMRAIAAKSLPGTQAELTFGEAYPPMPETEGNRRLLALYSQASEEAGYGPVQAVDPQDRGAGDVQYAAPYVDCLDGLGPWGSGSHTANESLDIASVERSAVRAALLIDRLTRPLLAK